MSIAETIGPSVRGAQRIRVLSFLTGAAGATGALVGWLAGVAWLALPIGRAAPETATAVVLGVVALELVGRPRPPAVRRQVPQLWGRILGAETVAVLYGARLGVGPATVLPTWLWWGALVLGASTGPWSSALVGAVFGLARVAIGSAAAAGISSGDAMARRLARIRAAERPLALVALAVVAGAALVGCSDDSARPVARPPVVGGEAPTTTSSTVRLTPELLAVDDLLLDDTLDGFHRDDVALGAGPMDLEAAARAEADVDAERALLETRGFVRGVSRGFVDAGGAGIYLAVYEFARSGDAAAYLADGLEHALARGAREFPVSDIAGARGMEVADQQGLSHAVVFSRGPRWGLVAVTDPQRIVGPPQLAELAERQARLLPA